MTNVNSKIEWTDTTWNVVTGCAKVSPGCDHCYAERMTERFHGKGSFATVTLHEDRLTAPLRWRKPRRVFVNSMSDLFHDSVPDEFIARVFSVMALTPQHTYQILTKRHGRMRSLVGGWMDGGQRLLEAISDEPTAHTLYDAPWPLPNVWLGVSVEDQKRAELRIPALLDTPAAVRFLSCEPLLGPVHIGGRVWLPASENDPDVDAECLTCGTEEFSDRDRHELVHRCFNPTCDQDGEPTGEFCYGPIRSYPRINWVIVGGESGPGSREMHERWARQIVTDCQAAGAPVFVKQVGSVWAQKLGADSKGGDPSFWPADLRVREFPRSVVAA